jgi:hypothetical protein
MLWQPSVTVVVATNRFGGPVVAASQFWQPHGVWQPPSGPPNHEQLIV